MACGSSGSPAFTCGDPVGADFQRQQVGIGEVAVVVGVFLAAHGAGFAAVGVEQYRGLADGAAFADFVDLPLHLEVDRLLHEAEGVEVLDLAPRAQRLAGAAHRDVGIAAEAAFLHVAVADADPLHQRVQGAGVGHGFGAGAHVGFGDDFQQRRAGAVEVDAGAAVEVLVQRLAGILFEVGAGQADEFFLLSHADRQPAALHHRNLELADLVALGQVGVEIILAREHRARRDAGAHGEAELDGADHGLAVEHRQHAGQGDVHGIGLDIGLGAEGDAAAGENLRLRLQLGMGFQPDDDFPLAHFNSSGIRTCQSLAFWYWCAACSILASPNQLPMICKPTGMPWAPKPQGSDMPGRPARLVEIV
jgi:hypothetical protein